MILELAERSQKVPTRGVLLVNTKSRQGEQWFAEVRQTLIAGGITLLEAKAFQNPKELPRAVESFVKANTPLVIVGGGDGTFSSIAHLCAKRETVLGVLPLGTGNAFARDLKIPVTVEGACDAILNGKVATVDMGLAGNRQFVNVATVGLTTKIALGLTGEAKKRLGRAVYVLSVIKALATVKPFQATLELPDRVEKFESLLLVVGNGRFHAGPFPVAPDASITGGWLSIYALASARKSAFLKFAFHLRGGKHVNLDDVKSFRTQSATLTTDKSRRVTIDGEVCAETPIKFGIVPAALRVAVPQDFGTEEI